MVNKAFNNKEKQDKFWANIEEVVTERLSRKPRRKRPPIDDDVLQSYCEMTDPEIALNDLTEETRNSFYHFFYVKRYVLTHVSIPVHLHALQLAHPNG